MRKKRLAEELLAPGRSDKRRGLRSTEDASIRRADRPITVSDARRQAGVAVAAAVVAFVISACTPADARFPAGMDAEIESARASVRHQYEGFPAPHFRFRYAHCFANGGLLIVFDQIHLLSATRYAYAAAGPGHAQNSWSGGLGIIDPATDTEIAHLFAGIEQVPCN